MASCIVFDRDRNGILEEKNKRFARQLPSETTPQNREDKARDRLNLRRVSI